MMKRLIALMVLAALSTLGGCRFIDFLNSPTGRIVSVLGGAEAGRRLLSGEDCETPIPLQIVEIPGSQTRQLFVPGADPEDEFEVVLNSTSIGTFSSGSPGGSFLTPGVGVRVGTGRDGDNSVFVKLGDCRSDSVLFHVE